MSDTPAAISSSRRKRFSPGQWSPLVWVLALSGVFFALFLAVSGIVLLRHRSSGSSGGASAAIFSGGSVGVLEINGVIMDSKRVLRRIEHFEEDPEIQALVVRINSPGGAVGPSQEIYQAIKEFKKPVVASMSSVAASGGYYIAVAAQKIFANPGTITGSIGVIMEFANLSKLYDWARVKRFSIKTGRFKDAGAEYKDMEPEARALLQAMVDDVLVQFKQAVAEGRKLTFAQVTPLADGRIFSGTQAKSAHLVDELGTLKDAIREAGKLAKIKGKPTVVYPDKPRRKLIEMLMDDGSKDDNAESESTIASATLGTWIRHALGVTDLAPESSAWRPLLTPGAYTLWTGGM